MSSENDPFSNLAHPPQAVRVKGRLPAQGHHASFGEIYSSTTVPTPTLNSPWPRLSGT